MAKVTVVGVKDYVPPAPLKGCFLVRCQESKISEYGSIQNRYEIIDGPELEDNSSPVGRQFVHFINVDMSKCTEQWQRDQILKEVKEASVAFNVEITKDSFETDEFIGKEAKVTVVQKVDKNGISRDTVTKMAPA